MNLSESLRHYANLLEDTQAQYIRKAIDGWNKRVGTADRPPKDPNDGFSPDSPPQADWSAANTERWLMQYGDVNLISKHSRHKSYPGTDIPELSVMLQERDWHDFVRYVSIVRRAYVLAGNAGDDTAADQIKLTLNRLQPVYKRRKRQIQDREFEQYDMEAKTRRDHPELYQGKDEQGDGGLEW